MEKITDKSFDEKTKQGLVLVNFTASWCQPCKLQKPTLEKFAQENEDCKVYQVDLDESPDTAILYNVSSIPTFVWFQDGIPVEKQFGLKKKEEFEKMLAQVKKSATLR